MITIPFKKNEIIEVDDTYNFRQGLIFLLTIDNVASVIGTASNGREFIDLLSQLKSDEALVDTNTLQMNNMEVAKQTIRMIPELKIIAFTLFGNERYYYTIDSTGVKGFILKSSGINEVEKAIQMVINGKNYLTDEILKKIIVNFAGINSCKYTENIELTAMETEVMQHVCDGYSTEEIGRKMSLSLPTVKDLKLGILEKFNH